MQQDDDEKKQKRWEKQILELLECHSTSSPEDIREGRESERCTLPPGQGDPRQIIRRFGRNMGSRPAPGATMEPSERPQRTTVMRQPISASTATSEDGSTTNVQVESEKGHILHSPEGANGLNYSASESEGGGVHFDMESYGQTPHPTLRRIANRYLLRPSWQGNISRSVEQDEMRKSQQGGGDGDGDGTV